MSGIGKRGISSCGSGEETIEIEGCFVLEI
jgi:hypothetical protein